MKRQLYKIKKNDWYCTIQKPRGYWARFATTKKALMAEVKKIAKPGDKVQIFKVNYEFKDSFVVGEK